MSTFCFDKILRRIGNWTRDASFHAIPHPPTQHGQSLKCHFGAKVIAFVVVQEGRYDGGLMGIAEEALRQVDEV